MQGRRLLSVSLAVLGIAACLAVDLGCSKKHKHQKHAPPMATPGFSITSTAFAPGGAIPDKHSHAGGNCSPPLAWTGAPAGTKEFALVVTDPDPPANGFVHWVVSRIPATSTGLPEGSAGGATEGKNATGGQGWYGPQPPPGDPHHYHFHLYALDAPIAATGASASEIQAAMKGHILGETELVGTFQSK